MPLPILAHQAPILPLKLWRPAAFNGTALVIGSIAPDLEYLAMMDPHADRHLAHSLAGQFLFCLPITLSIVLVVGRLHLAEVLLARLGARFSWLVGAATDVARPGGFRRACVSALLGSFSHLAFDGLTHEVLPRRLPAGTVQFAHLVFTSQTITQLVASGGGVLVSLWVLRRLSLRTQPMPPPRPGRTIVTFLAVGGAALGVLRARPAIRNPDAYFEAGHLYVWGHVAFFAACGAAAGVLLAGMILAGWDHRAAAQRA